MNRNYVITDTQIAVIKTQARNMKLYCYSTPETEANYQTIIEVLNHISGV